MRILIRVASRSTPTDSIIPAQLHAFDPFQRIQLGHQPGRRRPQAEADAIDQFETRPATGRADRDQSESRGRSVEDLFGRFPHVIGDGDLEREGASRSLARRRDAVSATKLMTRRPRCPTPPGPPPNGWHPTPCRTTTAKITNAVSWVSLTTVRNRTTESAPTRLKARATLSPITWVAIAITTASKINVVLNVACTGSLPTRPSIDARDRRAEHQRHPDPPASRSPVMGPSRWPGRFVANQASAPRGPVKARLSWFLNIQEGTYADGRDGCSRWHASSSHRH